MIKIYYILLSACVIVLFACSNSNEPTSQDEASDTKTINKTNVKKDVRETIWNQLSTQDKERIKGSWKDAKVTKIILKENMIIHLKNTSYLGKEVYLIDFPTINKSVPNNMIIYADTTTSKLIGYGLVD